MLIGKNTQVYIKVLELLFSIQLEVFHGIVCKNTVPQNHGVDLYFPVGK